MALLSLPLWIKGGLVEKNHIKRIFYIVLGSLSLAIGLLGVMIPVLPTTPFLLLTAFLYMRSSDRLYQWLINHKLWGRHLNDYITYRAIKKSTKIASLLFLWFTLTISMILVQRTLVTALLIVVGIAVSTHLLLLKTIDKDPPSA
jgi:hypothetical protein